MSLVLHLHLVKFGHMAQPETSTSIVIRDVTHKKLVLQFLFVKLERH
jgi:hypothetical protein